MQKKSINFRFSLTFSQKEYIINVLKFRRHILFYYELHLHTNVGSACGNADPEAYISYYKENGYSGIVVTDHFFYGNTAINRELEWTEHIKLFCDGYYRAKVEGDKQGLTVFFGFEHKFKDGADEYIILGLTPEWLTEHPEIKAMDRKTFFEFVRAAGGYSIQAHPYRVRGYIKDIRLSLDHVDAIEAFNSANTPESCRQAYEYAMNLGLPMVGGSDIHDLTSGRMLSGIALKKPAQTPADLINAIKSREAQILPIGIMDGIIDLPLEAPELKVFVVDGHELVETENYFCDKK